MLPPSSYTFTPNKDEVIESRFRLRYSTTCNSYYRDWSDAIDPSAQGVLPGWDKALYSVDSVHRLINEEVGQVYLERVPGSNTGCIKWHINFGCCGLLVDEVTIRLSCVEDFGGEIVVTLMGNPSQKRVRYPIGSDYVTYTELENSSELTLTVHFVGEVGQVTRLFPQSILRGMGYPLDVQVILKPPLQSLGRPRILVGLLYSSSQENEVDSRHYKQNTTNTGQGFLHIHLLRAKDLPQGKHGLPDAFSKCYLLPDAKKSTKCRTKTRKGKDPLWNEQYLIVGVNYHDIKRRALEICIADSHTSVGKKAKFLGGVRLSLGYKAVVAAQTKQVSQVLRFLKAKGGVSGGMKSDKEETVGTRESKVSFSDKDTVIANVNLSFAKWRKVSASGNPVTTVTTDKGAKAEIAKDEETTEMKAKNNTEGEQITSEDTSNDKTSVDATKADTAENEPQSASSTSTEDIEAAWDSVPDPTTNSPQDLDANPEKCANVSVKESEVTDSTSAVENTTAVTEVSCGSSDSMQVNSKNKCSVEERLFRSVMTSIKQLDFEARYGAMPKDCSDGKELECFNEDSKGDDQTVVNSCSNEDFEKGEVLPTSDGLQNEDVGKEELEKQESCEISNQIIENDAEKENNGLNEIEAVQKGDLAEDTPVLNDINTTNEIKESGNGNSPEFSENSRQEDDQEKNDLKEIETQCNGDLTDEVFVLNEIKEANAVKNAESEKENPTNSSENSGTEHEQKPNKQNGDEICTIAEEVTKKQNGDGTCTTVEEATKQNDDGTCTTVEEATKQNDDGTCTTVEEATKQEKTTKEDSLMKHAAVTETRGSVKSIEGKCNNISEPRNEEIKADSLQSDHTKAAKATRKTGSHELKHSSSFSLKDFGKKLSFRRRSKPDSEENGSETGLQTNTNKLMLDAQGLEITQWKLVVDRPKQWHYCWHILRPDMTILH